MKRLNAARPPIYLATRLQYPTLAELADRGRHFLELYGNGRKGFRPSDLKDAPTYQLHSKRALLFPAIYLPDGRRMSGLQRSFENWWEYTVPPPGLIKNRVARLKTGPEELRLAPGMDHTPGIRWVEFDPVANRDLTPAEALARPLSEGVSLAYVEVLMAAAYFPPWVMRWDGKDSPYPYMSGLQVCRNGRWSDTIFLNRNWSVADGQSQLIMGAWGVSTELWKFGWASPEVRIIGR